MCKNSRISKYYNIPERISYLRILSQHEAVSEHGYTANRQITKQFNTIRLSDGHFGCGTVSPLSNFRVSTSQGQVKASITISQSPTVWFIHTALCIYFSSSICFSSFASTFVAKQLLAVISSNLLFYSIFENSIIYCSCLFCNEFNKEISYSSVSTCNRGVQHTKREINTVIYFKFIFLRS